MPEREPCLVYVVTSGEYSSYGIHGVYSTEALAKADVERLGGGSATVEYYVLDNRDDVRGPWEVSFQRDGTVLAAGRARTLGPDWIGRVEAHVYVWARDEAQAIKAGVERWTQIVSTFGWSPGTIPRAD